MQASGNMNGYHLPPPQPLAGDDGRSMIAVCGMGMRLPGNIRNAHEFWDVLVNGRDVRSPIPSSRFNAAGFDDSLGDVNAIKAKHGYFLEEDLSLFDPSFFSMSQTELERCDPLQRLLLQVTRECLEDAGEASYRGKAVGCYVGSFGEDWLSLQNKDTLQTGSHILTGAGDHMSANRISYEYDLRGPRYR
jgi:acyl transferase domain-containing protein